ncbi:hypothetical protein [Dickeya undicola]|uniref:Uncharacterized protein n=1 Tax=Dickeya undicola TaxID=1577887 RepID=A0A3N0FRJ6_9GAMM|nr:hypothetical protein [Dickeya undicola]RNM02568.1 hypothetical protein EF878_19630 [Dickeya undicola]
MSVDKSKSFEFIKEYINNKMEGDIAWVGDTLPFIECEQLALSLSTNFRADPVHHNTYKVVFLFSENIFDYGNSWRLVLDESIRLLNNDGFLIIRSIDSNFGTLFDLKSQLFRNKNIDVILTKQSKFLDGVVISVFKIIKRNIINYNDKSWSIGILSNGKKEDVVLNLIESINKANHQNLPIEFIIAGPEIVDKRVDGVVIKYVNTAIKDDLPRISEKKNNIINAAEMANIAIFHDRYIVNDDFFDGFDNFGYNFDFLTIKQFYENGREFPAYLAFEHREKKWQRPLNIVNHDLALPGSFINGGLIVTKKNIFINPLFNSLLLHNEAEDVELAFHLSESGIVARFNGFSSSKTIGIPLDYTSTFVDTTSSSFNGRGISGRKSRVLFYVAYSIWRKLPNSIKDKLKRRIGLYEKIKNFIHHR